MDDTFKFVNVEAELITLMVTAVRVDSSVQIPNPRPAEFVQVNRVGGVAGVVEDNARVELLVWAATWPDAYDLAAVVRQRVTSITSLGTQPVYNVTELGLSRAPDPEDGNPRYRLIIEIKLRGQDPRTGG